ncbi:hypothetical protein [Brevibacillus parabrevis]|uniref:hypothetical protein n=1 Tax=Brevibacillus parabrevis TaxID=54914 RepID=UPI001F60E59A|nr:hypothetical protein [Brevibacillus parabrevis]
MVDTSQSVMLPAVTYVLTAIQKEVLSQPRTDSHESLENGALLIVVDGAGETYMGWADA